MARASSESNKAVFFMSLTLFLISIFGLMIVLNDKYGVVLTGRATGTGQANLTVESSVNINFTTALINWSSGMVNVGENNATLDSAQGNVVRGNWSSVSNGLVIENIGNSNVSLDVAAGKSAADFLGGTNPEYQWNFTNVEANSCTVGSGYVLGHYNNTNATLRVCGVFPYESNKDSIRIDIRLVVPYNSKTGALTDTLTATATGI